MLTVRYSVGITYPSAGFVQSPSPLNRVGTFRALEYVGTVKSNAVSGRIDCTRTCLRTHPTRQI